MTCYRCLNEDDEFNLACVLKTYRGSVLVLYVNSWGLDHMPGLQLRWEPVNLFPNSRWQEVSPEHFAEAFEGAFTDLRRAAQGEEFP